MAFRLFPWIYEGRNLIAAAEEKGYACDEDGDYLNIYKTARLHSSFNKDEIRYSGKCSVQK